MALVGFGKALVGLVGFGKSLVRVWSDLISLWWLHMTE